MSETGEPSLTEYTLDELDDIIFAAVTCGINAQGLIRRRNELAAQQAT